MGGHHTIVSRMERTITRVSHVIPQGASSQVENKQIVVGSEGWENTTPFLFLSEDWFGAPKGFEEHPHRGMQTVTVCMPRCGCSSNPFGAPNQSSLRKRNGVVCSQPSEPITSCLFSTCELAPCGMTRATRLTALTAA